MSMVQRFPKTKVIVFYDKEFAHQLARLEARFEFLATLVFPIKESHINDVLQALCQNNVDGAPKV